jgi:hypothetical protein
VTDFLNGKTYSVDAAVTGLGWRFTVDLATAQVYEPDFSLVDCAISLNLYALADRAKTLAPVASTPDLTLSLGSGLERPTAGNLAAEQWGILTITPTQCAMLLGDDTYRFFAYQWRVTPDGGAIVAAPVGEGYDGRFGLCLPGYGKEALAKLR